MVDRFSYRNGVFFGFALGVILVDQTVKYLVRSFLTPSEQIILITNILSLNYVKNTGASFGILRGMNTLLVVLGLCIVAFILYYMYQERKQDNSHFSPSFLFALIIGGAMSNIIDRVVHGFVIDFIQVPFWPAFNVADSVITLSVITLVIHSLRNKPSVS